MPARYRFTSGFLKFGFDFLDAKLNLSSATKLSLRNSVNALACHSLVPDLGTAVMIALDDFLYSALKCEVVMRNSCNAFRGKGFPRLASCPATPPLMMLFLLLALTTKTHSASAQCETQV